MTLGESKWGVRIWTMAGIGILAMLLALAPPVGADWPHTRGPAGDGRTTADGALAQENLALEVAWRVPLGSAYSGIAVAGNKVITGYAEGGSDWLGALDAATGKTVWKARLGEMYKGHDGSDDGPLSSPVVQGERVFFLDAFGMLRAFAVKDGEVLWQKDLTEEYGAEAPFYGFTTTAVSEGDTLVLATSGSEGRSMVGLDAATGETRWTYGDLAVEYQSPYAMELAGRRQVVVPSNKHLTGLDAGTGEVLWQLALGEQERTGSAAVVSLGEDRFLVPVSGVAVAYRVMKSAGGEHPYALEELYRSNVLGRTYASPVLHHGTLYGFRGQILSAMDAATGERKWRSREPGGDGLILVDDHLVIFGSEGNVVVAEADPESYVEVARVHALEGSSLTWPSYDDGRVFVRNLEEMAAVAITTGAAAEGEAEAADHGFGRFLDKVRAAPAENRQAMVDGYRENHPGGPVVEDGWVHFLYQSDAQEVAIVGSWLNERQAEALHRLEGTDLFYRSFPMEAALRLEYRFQEDYEGWVTDPENPRTVPPIFGDEPLSEYRPAGYPAEDHLAEPQEARGTEESFEFDSEILEAKREITVWLPPEYAEGEVPFPLLLVTNGSAWRERGLLHHSLENLVGKRLEPVVVAFVAPIDQWWTEAGGGVTGNFARMLAEELVPALEERYRLRTDREARAILGHHFYGMAAAYTALKYHDVFGAVALQTLPRNTSATDEVRAMIADGAAKKLRVYFDWNLLDERRIDRGYDMGRESADLAAYFAAHGARPAGGEQKDTGGWGGWRMRNDDILTFLFPAG